MSERNLTEVERLLLANQYRILEKLEPENAKDYAVLRKIIEEGYAIFYDNMFRCVYDPMNLEECRYVYDILDLYRVLRSSFEALPDKSGIDVNDLRFDGFDGNNESKQLAFARYLRDQGMWEEVLRGAGDLNSHSMTQHFYRRRLERYEAIKDRHRRTEPLWLPQLKKEEIQEIIARGSGAAA